MVARTAMCPGVRFSPEEWQALLCVRVGVPLQTAQPTCELCGAEDDRWGDHRLGCAKRRLHRRHNQVRDLLARECVEAGLWVDLEPCLVPGALDRPDLVVRGMATGPKPSEAKERLVGNPTRHLLVKNIKLSS